jgi:methylenetetrahydrofolate dehydrogenase (NADP+)/methenyltetrahydrofolate cyclohydrolase
MKLLLGKPVAEEIYNSIQNNNPPTFLFIIVVGYNEDTYSYVKMLEKKASIYNIKTIIDYRGEDISEELLVQIIHNINNDPKINKIMIQMPLPDHINPLIVNEINPEKDIDGLHSLNLGKLVQNTDSLSVGSALATIRLLDFYQINVRGLHVVIIGSSSFVGLPLSIHLIHKGASVTILNEYTKDIQSKTKMADILISACGKAHLVTKDWISENTILLDLGINSLDGKLVGDIDIESVKDIVQSITPVPGGIGPITTALLLKNCF